MWCKLVLAALLCSPLTGALSVYQTSVTECLDGCGGSVFSLPGFPDGLGTLEAYFLDWKLTGSASAGYWPDLWYEVDHFAVVTFSSSAHAILFQPSDIDIRLDLGPRSKAGTGIVVVGLHGSAHGRSQSSGLVDGMSGWLDVDYAQWSTNPYGYFEPPWATFTLDLTLVYKYVEYGATPEPGSGVLTAGPLVLAALALARRRWRRRSQRREEIGSEPAQ